MNVNANPSGFKLEPVHPKPEQAHTMPYAPAVHIVGACDLMFLSGATPSPLYHKHPHVDSEHVHPHSIEEQTARAMEAISSLARTLGKVNSVSPDESRRMLWSMAVNGFTNLR